MNIDMTAGHLADATKLLGMVIARRTTIPVLATVKCEKGRLTGTDLDMEARVSVPMFAAAKGTAAIDFHALAALAKSLPGDERLSIDEDNGKASVSFGSSRYDMAACPAADFPDFGAVKGEAAQTGNLGLVAAMKRVRFAMSTEATRYYLNGVAIIVGGDGLPVLVATNGHQLALMELPGAPEAAIGKIIHTNTVNFMVRLGREPESAVFEPERPRARFDWPGLRLSTKLVDGTYPDINRVLPKDARPRFALDRKRTLDTLFRMRAFVEVRRWAHVKLEGTREGLSLSMTSSDHHATEKLDFASPPAEAFACGYNIHYLIDAFSGLRGETVTFSADADIAKSPTVMTSEDDPLCIVTMPVRV